MVDINRICTDLYNGANYPGLIYGCREWGKGADFHEHPFFIWDVIRQYFLSQNINKKLNILETGRFLGQSTLLFSGIANETNGFFYSFDPVDIHRAKIIRTNGKYGISPNHYNYIADLSFNAKKYIPDNFKIDVLFLDSDHTYDCVKTETLLFEPYLSDKSIIFFHDTILCFDSVMGWIKDYLSNKNVTYVKHPNTHKPQCRYCEKIGGQLGLMHRRPHMVGNRPDFQADECVISSPHYQKLQYDFIPWTNKNFDQALQEDFLVFTNIEATCGIGALFINKRQ